MPFKYFILTTILSMFLSVAGYSQAVAHNILPDDTTRIEAESWDSKSGYQYVIATSDDSAGMQVVGITNSSWLDYNVKVMVSGTFTISLRGATTQANTNFNVYSNGVLLTNISFPGTGSWDVFRTNTSALFNLTAGTQTIRLQSTNTDNCNVNWISFATTNILPIANAGANQTITLPVSIASLTGSGTDADGSIASYSWTQVSGTAAIIANPSLASTGVSDISTAGERVFKLVVTDNLGATASSTTMITADAVITNGKIIPGTIQAEAWDAKTGFQYAWATADTSGISDMIGLSNGCTLDYNVNVTTTGAYTISLRGATTQAKTNFNVYSNGILLTNVSFPNTGGWTTYTTIASASFTLTAGTQTIRLQSTNNENCNLNWISFKSVNQLPVANAGANQIIILPVSAVTLTGSGIDADGSIASYSWTQVSGTTASIATPLLASTGIAGMTTAGARVFKLTVTDNLGAAASSNVTVTVNAAATNGKTIPGTIEAEAWDAKTGFQYANVTADISGVSDMIGLSNGCTLDYNVNVTTTRAYTLSIRGATTQANTNFNVYSNGILLTNVSFPSTGSWGTYRTTASAIFNLSAGTQIIRLQSTNNDNCNINWISFSSGNQLPVANAGAYQTITLPGNTITLTGSGTDADGTITGYSWTQLNGTIATIENAGNATSIVSGLNTAGTRVFRLTVIDNSGGIGISDVIITVNPAPVAPGSQIKMGIGKYVTLFIDPATGLMSAIGNRGMTGVGGNGPSAGSSSVPEPVLVVPSNLQFKYAAGSFHSGAAIDVNGNVWTMGEVAGGVSGMGNLTYSSAAQKILVDGNGNPFINVAAIQAVVQTGAENTTKNGWLALKEDGTIWIWGTVSSALGDGSENPTNVIWRPVQIFMPGNRLVKQIVGGYYIIVLCTDNTVWTWGSKASIANLGYIVSDISYRTPQQLTELPGIKQVEGGNGFNWALGNNDSLYAWGSSGNLMGDTTNSTGYGATIKTTRTVPVITNAFGGIAIKKIVTSSMNTLFLLADSSLWSVGDNTQGTVGNCEEYFGTPATGYGWDGGYIGLLVKVPVHIAPGVKFVNMFSGNKLVFWNYALDANGKLYAWGTNKGSTIANKILGAAFGTIDGTYPNAFDVPCPTEVNPYTITTAYISTCPACVIDSTGPICGNYPIPVNIKPVPNAGNNQQVTGSSITLDGTGSMDNVHITYYKWYQVSGPNTASINLPASSTPTMSGLITGNYVFRLRVTDNGWYSDSAGVVVSVNGATGYINVNPTVKADARQTIVAPVNTTILTGSATDLDGRIVAYAWSTVKGPNSPVFQTPSGYVTNVTNLIIGTYIFSLTVTDNAGATATANDTVVVTNDHPPTVSAGANQTIIFPVATTTLTGIVSNPDNEDVYDWQQIFGAYVTITNAAALSTGITGLSPGGYKFKLTVTDSNGAASSSIVAVSVNGASVNSDDNAYPKVGLAEYSTFFIDSSKTLTAIGNREFNGVGIGQSSGNSGLPLPVISSAGNKFKYVSGGFHFGAAIDTAGYVWTMGDASGGLTGNGSSTYSPNARQVMLDADGVPFNNVMQIAALVQNESEGTPLNSWLALKKDGSLWIWGTPGPMRGNGTDTGSKVMYPTRIILPSAVKMITGGNYAIALLNNGDVYTWGSYDAYNMGYGYTGTENLSPHKLVQLSGINSIAGGKGFNYALKSDGTLYGWGFYGDNLCDQTIPGGISFSPYAQPTLLPFITSHLTGTITKIVTNYSVTYAICSDSTLWSWGDNTQGLIGNGDGYYGNAITGYQWDFGTYSLVKTPYHIAPGKKFINVFTGNTLVFRVFALMSDKNFLSWGTNKGSVLADKIESAGVSGRIQSTYPNSWDRHWPTPVCPFDIAATFVTTCQACVLNPQATDCYEYAIPANTNPSANAGTNQTISANRVVLDGSGSINNVFISYYEWKQLSGPNTAVIDLPASSVANAMGLIPGTYVFRLKVTDNGWLTDSAMVTVVKQPGNQTLTVNAGPAQAIFLPTSTVTLTGSATDSGGTITSYAWTQISGAPATIATPYVASTGIAGITTRGARVFRLTVTDNLYATASSDVTITADTVVTIIKTIPGRIEAEAWDNRSGYQQAIPTDDAGGGQQVVGISNGSWMDYYVNVLSTGTYTASFRVATTQVHAQFQLKLGNTLLGVINIPNTSGWGTWLSPGILVPLTAGYQTLRIISTNDENCNLNWVDFGLSSQVIITNPDDNSFPLTSQQDTLLVSTAISNELIIFPNPVQEQFVLQTNNDYEGKMIIQIKDANENVRKEIQVDKLKGCYEVTVSAAGLPTGLYIIRVQMGSRVRSIKMIKL